MDKNLIAVYGGCFNPPTVAHIQVMKNLTEIPNLYKVIVVPVGDKYNKKELIKSEHRINMLHRVDLDKVEISEIETSNTKTLTTIETLNILKNQYPNKQIRFVVGADNLIDIVNWNNVEDILRDFGLIVLNRGAFNVEDIIRNNEVLNIYKDNIEEVHIDDKYKDVTSTEVRNALKTNNTRILETYLDREIFKYILNNKLYM